MEVRNTPPEKPPGSRSTIDLIRALGLALREVGVSERWNAQPSQRMEAAIQRVQELYRELGNRNVDLQAPVRELSEKTSWRMDELLRDCVSWPKAIPRVREKDGILRYRRCNLCRAREYPDPGDVPFCDDCMQRITAAIGSRTSIEGLFLYRTFNASHWCPHADSETILATTNTWDLPQHSYCTKCLTTELIRRQEPGLS